MAIITFPELTLKGLLDVILKKIKDDYNGASVPKESFLYRLYGGLKIGNYDVFETAVNIFNCDNSDARKIDTRLMYDNTRANIPTIHVIIPEEIPNGDGIGMDEGYQEATLNSDNTTLTEYLARAYDMKFRLYITSDNSFETVIIHNVIKAALIINIPSLQLNGYRNVKIYGNDLKINEQLTPSVFMRAINLDCNYEFIVPNMNTISVVNDITLKGKPYV